MPLTPLCFRFLRLPLDPTILDCHHWSAADLHVHGCGFLWREIDAIT
jgi:hypothetical protein